jgi:hypothetical protein
VTDEPRQPDGAAVHERDAEAATEDAEDGALRGDAQVAPQGELETAGHGVTLDGCDDRLGRQHPRDAERRLAVVLDAHLTDGVQVRPRAEAASRAGEHRDGQRLVGVKARKGRGQRACGAAIDGVADVRTVDGHHQDAAVAIAPDRAHAPIFARIARPPWRRARTPGTMRARWQA